MEQHLVKEYEELVCNHSINKEVEEGQIWVHVESYKKESIIVIRSLPYDKQIPLKTWRYWSLSEFNCGIPSPYTYDITEEELKKWYTYCGTLKN